MAVTKPDLKNHLRFGLKNYVRFGLEDYDLAEGKVVSERPNLMF
jgi:hypothetical protein